ncbi:methyl-galactoside transport system permease protein [Breznakia blatticola]|uniref:Methyl-galactoside transport system permease protein n=1 Tax=Breznakia blatticola TaxID=1754012 RepID=A0A4R8A6M8_9FIRM|nr:beta-methylgalactoside transporter [Breznakia blatticola]TDW26095.1 methyl-galactoside transport system permease protein [Breznakia blatticola]
MVFKNLKFRINEFKEMDSKDRNRLIKETLINNSLLIFMLIAIIYIQIQRPQFLSRESIINIVSLSASAMPLALGVAGAIILTGTDLSAGRIVGLTACISASLLQAVDYSNKMFPDLPAIPIIVVFLLVIALGALIGFVNGFCVSKFSLHPFIVTLATQLMVYGVILMYLMNGDNNGQSISGLSSGFTELIKGSLFRIGGTPVPNYVLMAIVLTAVMWVVWNKTSFGKNMFAVGSNPEAANVSGVNVALTITLVFTLAGALYAFSGFIEAARIGSNSANTGLNYELDAIAACVIGGVSFVGGIGKIRGVVLGVVLLKLIFVGLNFLSVSVNMIYIIKGLIILVACAIDMRKYLVRK